MEKHTYQTIKNAFKTLQSQEKQFEKEKVKILISLCDKIKANKSITKGLREYGLPKRIFTSLNLDKEIITALSFFCEVHRHSSLIDPCIIFSWENAYSPNFDFLHNLLNHEQNENT